MTWGKVAGELHSHPKWTGCNTDAKAFWATALSYCSEHLTNGVILEMEHLPTIALCTFGPGPSMMRKGRAACDHLSQRGLFDTMPGGWRFHDWKDRNPTAQQVKQRRRKDRRRDDLHKTAEGRKIKAQVRQRDSDGCRYCLTTVRWGANRASDGGTFDHVDPDAGNTVDNVVVACNYCNGRKRDITPDEAGMVLQPPPAERADQERRRATQSGVQSRSNRDSIAIQSSRTTEPGTGRDGTERIGSGLDGPSGAAEGGDGDGDDSSSEGTDDVDG